MSSAIITHRLTKIYQGRRVVDNVDVRVPTGCVYGFLGRNGAGKSTFIKMLLGLVHPDVGTAEILAEDVRHLSPATRRRVAYLAEGHPLYRWMTVKQMARFTESFYPTWKKPILEGILDHFNISLAARIRKLSNGQKAQVSLALALAADPDLLILDDPTLGLDTVVRRDFLESVIQLIQGSGRTVFFSSHNLGDVERVADRIGIMVDGILRVDCPMDHFKSSLRRIVLTFSGQPTTFPDCPGLVSQRASAHRLELVIVGYNQEHAAIADSLGPNSIDVVEMNLEDAFISYTRREAPPLPRFDREPVPC